MISHVFLPQYHAGYYDAPIVATSMATSCASAAMTARPRSLYSASLAASASTRPGSALSACASAFP